MNENVYQQQFKKFLDDHPSKKLSINGNVWKYFISEKQAERKTLLILHGGGSIAEATHKYFAAFENDYNVIAPTMPSGLQTVEAATEGIEAILKEENIKEVMILGFSMGGMVAQCMVRKYPKKIQKLILFVSMLPSKVYGQKYERYRKLIALIPGAFTGWISKRSLKRQIMSEKVDADDAEKQFWADFFAWSFDTGRMNKEMLVSTASVLVDYFNNYEFEVNDLEGWTGKALIFESDKDRVVNENERARLRLLYPEAGIITMENSGHFGTGLVNTQPVIDKMRAFLES